MRQPLRNAGVRASLLVFLVALGLSLMLALSAGSWQGWALFGVAAGAAGFNVALTFHRYRMLADMAEEIDAILHGKETLQLEK